MYALEFESNGILIKRRITKSL